MKVKYTTNGNDYPFNANELETTWDEENIEYIAEDAASDFHENCGGWEHSWPVDIEIFIDEKSVGVFEVEREYDPAFMATPKG